MLLLLLLLLHKQKAISKYYIEKRNCIGPVNMEYENVHFAHDTPTCIPRHIVYGNVRLIGMLVENAESIMKNMIN